MRFSILVVIGFVFVGVVGLQVRGLQPAWSHETAVTMGEDSARYRLLSTGHEVYRFDTETGTCWFKTWVAESWAWERVLEINETLPPVPSRSGGNGDAISFTGLVDLGTEEGALIQEGDDSDDSDASAVLAALVRVLGDDPSPGERDAANRILAGLGGAAVPALRQLLADGSDDAKVASCAVVCAIGSKARDTAPELLDLTKHNESKVREAALRALEAILQ